MTYKPDHDPRPGWDLYFLGIADAVSRRADCTRRQVGSVIVAADHQILATGYNGAPSGEPGCLSAGACPRGQHFMKIDRATLRKSCGGCGKAWPCPDAVAPGSSYDTGKGSCISVHSEMNALIRAGDRSVGAVLYCTEKPCDGCFRAIKGAGIVSVVYPGDKVSLCSRRNRSKLRTAIANVAARLT